MYDEIEEAQYRVVHEFPGGAVKLAPLVNMASGTLSNKVNPSMEGHQLNVREMVAITNATKDFRILYAINMALGHACVHVRDFSGCSDTELLCAYAEWHAEIGRTAAEIKNALSDGKVTRAEIRRIKREFYAETRAGLGFIHRLKAICEPEEGDSDA